MAKYIDTSFSASGQPFGTNALNWLYQGLSTDTLAQVFAAIGINYNPSTVYALSGCRLTSSAGTTSVEAGYCFSGGVFYQMNAASYPDPSGGDVNIMNLVTTYGDFGGTTFEDTSVHNVLVLETITCSAGASGSGTAGDYSGLVFLYPLIESRSALNGDTIDFTRDRNIIYSSSYATGGAFTLSYTNAVVGAELVLYTAITGGGFSATIGGGATIVYGLSGTLVPTGTHTVVYIKYLGKIGATNYILLSYTE